MKTLATETIVRSGQDQEQRGNQVSATVTSSDSKQDDAQYNVTPLASEQKVQVDLESIKKPKPKQVPPAIAESPLIDSSASWIKWLSVLLLGAMTILLFSVYAAWQTVQEAWSESALIGSLLGIFLVTFVMALGYLIAREVQIYTGLNRIDGQLNTLKKIKFITDDKQAWLAFYQQNQAIQNSLMAREAHRQFFQSIKPHHSLSDIQQIYRDQVTQPIRKVALKGIKNDMMASAAISGLSPNALFQSVLLIWLHLKMVRKVSQIYGLRTSLVGEIKLLKMAFGAMAALSLTDMWAESLMSDVLGPGVLAKISAQSAEAMISARLTYRLGDALVKTLSMDEFIKTN